FNETGLTNEFTYLYRVTAMDQVGQESVVPAQVSATPTDPPPSTPTGLTASAGNGEVTLSWDSSPNTDWAGNHVYRSDDNGATYVKRNNSLLTANSFNETGLTNEFTYLYRVTAVDQGGQESVVPAQVNATPTEATDLVGHWKFDEVSGSNANDSSGNDNHGSLFGNPTWFAPGQVGGALDFDGSGDGVLVNGSESINNMDAFTVSLWFYADTVGQKRQGRIIDKNQAFEARFSAYDSRIYFDAERWSGNDGKWRFKLGNSLLGSWHHLVLTYDYSSTNNDPVLYVDGVQASPPEELKAPSGTPASDTGVLAIGNRASGNRSFDGRLDDVKLFNRALVPAEVTSLYQPN
ncbi:MAG: LamG-like jellyroll fold domain-containing protein, partial [Dehalococcoidia bacterium]